MPRKNKAGQPPKLELKKRVHELRGFDLSFAEIGEIMKISRQLAYYHSKDLSTGKGIDKGSKV